MNDDSILPPHSTRIEAAVEAAARKVFGDIPVDFANLWNPLTCPEPLLGHLAWALSVDDWSDGWSAARKRAVILASIPVHRKKGTRPSVIAALRAVQPEAEVAEWWEHDGPRGTYRLRLPALDDASALPALLAAARHTTPVHMHLERVTTVGLRDQAVRIGTHMVSGDRQVIGLPVPQATGAARVGIARAESLRMGIPAEPFEEVLSDGEPVLSGSSAVIV